ncbi:MAG TPA: glycosyltransferase family 4 protein [Solirubrobacterales bacterium]|nr:glycosyltransferase family 4 protein [Solirubrobacterales bacterium]
MFRPQGEAPDRAAGVAAALEGAGHEVGRKVTRGVSDAIRSVVGESPEVVHAVGAQAFGPAAVAARLAGAALICEALPADRTSAGGVARAMRTAAGGARGGTVLAPDDGRSSQLRTKLGLPYSPVVVGGLESPASVAVLSAVYDRLPRINPELPADGAGGVDRARRWLGELLEPARRGGLRRPRALIAYARGRRLRARGKLPGAAEALGEAARRDPADPMYELYAAKALRESGERDRALETLETLVARPDAGPGVLGEAGLELTRLGERERAKALAARLAEGAAEDPASAESLAEAARVHAAAGDLNSARDLALRAAGEAPDRSDAQRTAALALELAGEPSRAVELARRSGERDQERRLAGLLRELEPGWTPRLDRIARIGRGATRAVLALLEVSLPHAPSGYAYRSRDLLEAIREAGFDALAATRLGFPASRGLAGWSPIEQVDGVVHHRYNVPGLRQYSGVPVDVRVHENAERILDLVESTKPAAIVAGTPDLNGVAALAVRSATGIPVVYDVRGFPEMSWAAQTGGSDTELYRARRAAETACASAADAVITLSETMRSELSGRGIDSERIFVVPQIVDVERFAPRPGDDDLARSYGLDGRLVIGSVTSLTDYEGIDDLIRSVALARAERPEVAALVVGDGAYRPALEKLVAELGLGESVVFTGRLEQDRVPDHYALLDLFAIPRRDLEVCRAVTPLKPFEALAMRLPVLASDLPALAEIVSASGGGRTVTPGSDRELARAIVDLAGDASAREQFGRNGRDYVLAHHTPDRASAAIGTALAGLVGENGGTR